MATTPATTASGSSGILQSLGVGSGIDINSLVTQLVTATMQPANSQLAAQTQSVGTQISALGQLKGALSTFQSALSTLNSQASFQTRSATSGDEKFFNATAGAGASPGNYQIEVDQLAQGEQVISNSKPGDGTTDLGAGTLLLNLGSKSFSVAVTADKSSLADIRDAINSATDNPGISATLVHGNNTVQLVLTSNLTGAGNAVRVSTNDGALSALAYDGTETNYKQLQKPQDSEIHIAGVQHNSPTNTVTDAVDGVTLNLNAETTGDPITLSVANDKSTVAQNVQQFVSAYNSLQGVIAQLGTFNSDTQTAGPLLGQELLITIQGQLGRGLTSSVSSISGPLNSLAGIGVTTNKDGTLSLDKNKLQSALNTNFSAVGSLFASTDGVATRLSSFVASQLSSSGGIALRNQTLTQQQTQIANDQTTINLRTQQLTLRYQAQFTAMDTLLAKMQKTSSFITQQFQAQQSQTLSISNA